jgi:hypothetical protein
MTAPLLTDCWGKLERAEGHFKVLKAEVMSYLESKPFAMIEEFNSEQAKYLFKLKIIKPIPQFPWALIVGDCVHNARSALDYLAWRLAGSDLADKATIFPIKAAEPDFKGCLLAA